MPKRSRGGRGPRGGGRCPVGGRAALERGKVRRPPTPARAGPRVPSDTLSAGVGHAIDCPFRGRERSGPGRTWVARPSCGGRTRSGRRGPAGGRGLWRRATARGPRAARPGDTGRRPDAGRGNGVGGHLPRGRTPLPRRRGELRRHRQGVPRSRDRAGDGLAGRGLAGARGAGAGGARQPAAEGTAARARHGGGGHRRRHRLLLAAHRPAGRAVGQGVSRSTSSRRWWRCSRRSRSAPGWAT